MNAVALTIPSNREVSAPVRPYLLLLEKEIKDKSMARWYLFEEDELKEIRDALDDYSSGDPDEEVQRHQLIINKLLEEVDDELMYRNILY